MNTSFNFGSNAVKFQSGGDNMAAEVVKKKGTPANETASQKIVRLANKRVNKAITQIRLIGNLGSYGPTEQQRNNIVRAIDSEVMKMKKNIASDTPETEEGFKLA